MEPPKDTTRGMRNNNPLNIERGDRWEGLRPAQTDPRFCQFTSVVYGLRAAIVIIRNYMRHYPIDTIAAIIRRWAPPRENDTAAYIRTVSKITNISQDKKIKFTDKRAICAIVAAMARVESSATIDPEIISKAYDLAK